MDKPQHHGAWRYRRTPKLEISPQIEVRVGKEKMPPAATLTRREAMEWRSFVGQRQAEIDRLIAVLYVPTALTLLGALVAIAFTVTGQLTGMPEHMSDSDKSAWRTYLQGAVWLTSAISVAIVLTCVAIVWRISSGQHLGNVRLVLDRRLRSLDDGPGVSA